MKAKELFKKGLYILAALFLCVTAFIGGRQMSAFSAFADSVNSSFDNSPISEDLHDIDVLRYPKNPLGKYKLLRLTEFCYSERPFLAEAFGLYLYVYNPTETELETDYNTVNMVTSYNSDGKPASYDNFNLIFLDSTTNHRFYKFKIENPQALSTAKSYAQAHNGERRYDISDIFLRPTSLEKDQDGVSRTYYFSGYAKNCSDETANASTLKSRYEGLDTIDLEVNHTSYRMDSKYQAYTYQEVNSVYFSVPEIYFTKYGGLQKIKSTWYEYKTKPVFVVNSNHTPDGADCYDFFKQHIGGDLSKMNRDDRLYWVMWDEFHELTGGSDATEKYFLNVYNHLTDFVWHGLFQYYLPSASTVDCMYWLFDVEGENREGYKVSRERVEKYIKDYTTSHSTETKLAGKYAQSLFTDSIDEERIKLLENKNDKRGKITQEIDADEDVFSLFEFKTQSWWEKFLCKPKENEAVMENVSPISVIEEADIGLSQSDFCKKYLVSDTDYKSVIDYCNAAFEKTGAEKVRPVIFHFAVNDYRSSPAIFDHYNGTWGDNYTIPDYNGYVAQETVFLDYKIISLTFRDNGNDTVIGVVSNPLDIINGLDPSDDDRLFHGGKDGKDVLKIILAILFLILLVVIFAPLLPPIINFLIWLITLPFKLIGALFKGIGNLFKKDK